jgi:hypothetical protein
MALFHQNANQAIGEINNILNNIENNRMRHEINNIINRNPVRIFIHPRIYYNENGIMRSVLFINPDDWNNHYNEDPNNNFNTIQICYEYSIINTILELRDKIIRRNNLIVVQDEDFEGWVNEMEYIQEEINNLTQVFINISNIYFGLLLEHDMIQN